MRARLAGLRDCLVQIAEAGHGEELLRHVVLNPRGGAQGCVGIALQVALLDGLRVAHHFPSVAGEIGAMNDENADGAAARRLFIFVGPAAVVGERSAFEEPFVVGWRLIHDDQRDFAVQVDLFAIGALEVIPVIFGSANAVTDEYDRRVEVRGVLAGLVFGDDVGAIGEIGGLTACGFERELCFVFESVDGEERNFLEEGATFACGLHACESELRGNVFSGEFGAARTGATAFEQIEGEEADMRADPLGVNALRDGRRGGRQASDLRACALGRLLSARAERSGEQRRNQKNRIESAHGFSQGGA